MPHFEIDDFLSSCSSREIDDLIDTLIEDGHLTEDCKKNYELYAASEQEFQNALKKLNGKWNMLTQEEEQAILKIASRF